MPQPVAKSNADPRLDFVNRVRWTRRQAEAIQAAGSLTGRYELIAGEILSKMGRKPPHTTALGRLFAWLTQVFRAAYVRIEATLDVSAASPDYDEPEPDATVTCSP